MCGGVFFLISCATIYRETVYIYDRREERSFVYVDIIYTRAVSSRDDIERAQRRLKKRAAAALGSERERVVYWALLVRSPRRGTAAAARSSPHPPVWEFDLSARLSRVYPRNAKLLQLFRDKIYLFLCFFFQHSRMYITLRKSIHKYK